MKRFDKVLALGLSLMLLASAVIGCGKESGALLDDQAATRGIEEGAGEIYIDDEAIALAGSAASSQAALDACTAVFNLVNQNRVANGLGAFVWSDALTNAAQVRAQEIVGKFSHTRPNGTDFWTVDSSVQYGENLAKLYQSADSVYTAWMNSPTHAANIMDGSYKTIGIAIYQADDGSWYWAQEFGY